MYPFYKNIGKRVVKSPKLYFSDTALISYLLGLHDHRTLLHSPHFAHIFETYIVIDFWKRFLHFGQMPSVYYFRTRDGLEIDLVIEINQKLYLFEIKSSMTITSNHASSLLRAKKDLGKIVESLNIISLSSGNFSLKQDVNVYNWQDILLV